MVPPAVLVLAQILFSAGRPAAADEVTVLDERLGIRTAPILLLARPDVQLDLHLDPEQVSRARSMIGRLLEEALQLKDQSGPSVAARRLAIDEEMTQWLVHHLAKDQLERLRQIDLQWEGPAAIGRPFVAEYLKLSDTQQLTVDRLIAAHRQAWRARGRLTAVDRESFSRQALSVLSPVQRALWDRLLGPPCRWTIGGQAARSTTGPGQPGPTRQPAPTRP
jgi:hypothetical protein